MRSTLDIIIAVEECREATPEELRLALIALGGIGHFLTKDLDALVEAIEKGEPPDLLELRAGFAKVTRERMFQAKKLDPTVWLGRGGTPGTPEYAERRRLALAVAAKAGVLGEADGHA